MVQPTSETFLRQHPKAQREKLPRITHLAEWPKSVRLKVSGKFMAQLELSCISGESTNWFTTFENY